MTADIFFSGALHSTHINISTYYSSGLQALHSAVVLHMQNSSGTVTYRSAHKCHGFKTRLQCATHGMLDLSLHHVFFKKQPIQFLIITSANIDWFSKLFH